ncbi:uncharacterized protein LOC133191891 isoform X2 [Saccostrea echinata]|uniref:uncharacterized protein LOC133191891 isoform X2 n=1 Tax=Saccostrea echinata TaxID=191078 RepID=UPI002A811F09|nr:uncharacterized protein LOC133191891 isoform X2 [Saccostrea echinata]
MRLSVRSGEAGVCCRGPGMDNLFVFKMEDTKTNRPSNITTALADRKKEPTTLSACTVNFSPTEIHSPQMTAEALEAQEEEECSVDDGYDPGLENTARSSPLHLSEGALSGHTEEHCSWDRQLEYILACCSFVNGVDSILWFPKMAALHGGGVFFVIYLLLTLTCGFPLLYMETILGQYARGGPAIAWDVVPLFRGLGVAVVMVSTLVSLYYGTTLIWAMYFLVHPLSSASTCNNTGDILCSTNVQIDRELTSVNTSSRFPYVLSTVGSIHLYQDILQVSAGIGHTGHLVWYFVVCLVILWAVIFIILILGPRSLGKAVYITYGLAQVLAVSLMVHLCTEDGALRGIKGFLNMKWDVLGNLEAWVAAGMLMFSSLGLGTGSLTSLAGYTHFHSHCFRNCLLVITAHLVGMLVSGFTIFAALGINGQKDNNSINHHNMTALDLVFTLMTSVIARTNNAQVWKTIFFLTLILMGVGTQCTYLQNIVSALLHFLPDRWRFRWKFKCPVLAVVCCVAMVLGLLLTTQGGLYLFYFSHHYVGKLSLYLIAFGECVSLAWVYGAQRLWNNVSDMTGTTDSPWWKLTWKFLTPVVVFGLIIVTVVYDEPLCYSTYQFPDLSHTVGLMITLLPVLPVPVFIFWCLWKNEGNLKHRIKASVVTSSSWGPGQLANQEPGIELPDYVICTPDNHKPENALAILTANLYIPNLTNLISAQVNPDEDPEMSGGYLTDLMAVDNGESEDEDDTNHRGNWSSRMDFVLSCLGYVVGLGNVWRFPYLVFRNGGGAFFIPYTIMLIFCGIPLVYMELAFGQYASLGPVTVWRAVPIFKGIGISMVLASTLVGIYYNMVNAWAFHYLFSSMMATLPWLTCNNAWNQDTCSLNKYEITNCSLLNISYLYEPVVRNISCVETLLNCSDTNLSTRISDPVVSCIGELRDKVGDEIFLNSSWINSRKLTSPSEEYFYNKVLKRSGSMNELGSVQYELALCLLLCWVIVFICLIKGVRTSGKVAYLVVIFPFLIMLTLLVRALTMEGNMTGIKFYVAPKWEKLQEPSVWGDAAVQVFFSLSVCMGGLTTLSSYNKFHNNIYSDAILVCLGDTLMSMLAGFSVFAMMGVLSNELDTDIEKVITSGIGLTFIVNPAAMSYFPIAPLWSVLFFLMIIMLGLSTQFVQIETIITAIMDENLSVFRGKRIVVLFLVCSVLFLLGLPLSTQGGIYVLTLIDEYAAGFATMVNGVFMCIAIGWIYGVRQFCTDIKRMIGQSVGYWWKALWCVISPIIITFIIIFSCIGYKSLSEKYNSDSYPPWSEVLGFFITSIPVLAIPLWIICKLALSEGGLVKRLKKLCQAESSWGPALERNWKNVEYYPAVNTNTLAVDVEHSPLHTVTDHVDFTTVGVKVPSLSSQASLLPKSLSPKKPRDMRERAILNHAYSNPQCHQSIVSIEKAVACGPNEPLYEDTDVLIVQKCSKRFIEMKDVATQTEPIIKKPPSTSISSSVIQNKPESINKTPPSCSTVSNVANSTDPTVPSCSTSPQIPSCSTDPSDLSCSTDQTNMHCSTEQIDLSCSSDQTISNNSLVSNGSNFQMDLNHSIESAISCPYIDPSDSAWSTVQAIPICSMDQKVLAPCSDNSSVSSNSPAVLQVEVTKF